MNCPSCKRPTATVEGELLCHYHLRIFNKSGKQLEAPNKKSIKQAAADRVYAGKCIIFKLEHPVCEVKLPGCTGKTAHVHHPWSGCNRSSHYLDVDSWVPICEPCHQHLHDKLSAEEAKERGLKFS